MRKTAKLNADDYFGIMKEVPFLEQKEKKDMRQQRKSKWLQI